MYGMGAIFTGEEILNKVEDEAGLSLFMAHVKHSAFSYCI